MKIHEINIIGAGSLGSFTAQILSKMDPTLQCPLRIWDFDQVEEHNINNQLYSEEDIGSKKILSLQNIISKLGGPEIKIVDSKVDKMTDLRGIVIATVDTMQAREEILRACKFNWGVDYLIEARMGGHIGKIYALDSRNWEAVTRYSQFLYSDKDVANPICATNETIPTLLVVAASIAKAILIYKNSKILKNNFVEVTVDLINEPIVNSNTYALI